MPAETASEWDQVEEHARQHPLRTPPLNRDSIKVSQQPHPAHKRLTEVRARLHLTETLSVDNDSMWTDRHEPRVTEEAERRLRHELRRKIYGKLREDARELALEIRRAKIYHADFDRIQALLEPLLNAGHELTDKPTQQPQEGA